jgi:hypothetical protein
MNIYHSYIYRKNTESRHTQQNQHSLNFYTYLYSYILLKKLYRHVTMICNQDAFDLFVKHIPYDDVVIINPKEINDYKFFWSQLKVNSYQHMQAPFIHVDGDVLIFEDLFRKFTTGNHDIMIQSVELTHPANGHDFSHYINSYDASYQTLKNNGYELSKLLDFTFNCGVMGMKNNEFKGEFISAVNLVSDIMRKNQHNTTLNDDYACFLEQYILTDLVLKRKLKYLELFDRTLMYEKGMNHVAHQIGYTHFWGSTKYKPEYIKLMKDNIRTKFKEYSVYIEKFENR